MHCPTERWVVVALACGAAAAGLAVEARADDAEAETPKVSLDRLLKLPADTAVVQREERRVAGATRDEWQTRFRTAQTDLAEAQGSLRSAQDELEEMASKADAWQLTAPGAQVTPENSPVSFKLRQDIRRYREDIDRYEAALTELRIEANLAGVPAAWQRPVPQEPDEKDRLAGSRARPGRANSAVSAK